MISRNEFVLALLRTRGPMSPQQIAAALEISVEQAGNTLSSLRRAKKVRRVGRTRRAPKGVGGGPKTTSVWALAEVALALPPEPPARGAR